ncbi:Ig-like domain-containing protein [Moraxella nonliquefaciens]|uniref:Ig-like domain-containing protein n=1 Tax=Moraxella nonliquefaciens TaxID=478 RepID=UPI00081ED6FB|nr:Ig-like domain-containing protein [Moraxella nonliquefaciens]OBX50358.1 hypothetical protein A9Z65_06690 [Moraxella nonliquefaciens]
MKSISVKVNDSVQTIAQTKVVTKDSQPTVIKAIRNANYELINDATGYAPDHIVTKRVGKDLHISFEDDAKESDLIIKDFYDYDKSALIGQAESGQYHYYVPDTGLTQDYVTELVIGDIEGQALGGQGYPAPWWIGAEEGSRFGVMPWLVGIAGLAGIAAVVSGRDDKGNDNNNNANASAQEKPPNIENIQSDTVAQGATQALNFTVTSNGQNVSQAIISVNGTELKDANNKTVLTDKDGKVNITAQLLKANGIKLGELLDFTISAEEEHYTQATATLHNPGVVKMDGGVVVTPHESATELEVTYTKPDQTVSTAKFTKNTNGDGKAGAWIDNNKDDSVTIDPATGKVVIPVNTIGSNTNVTAKQTTDVGTTNNSKGVSDILSAKPVVEAIKTGDNAGNVVIKPSDDAINGSKVVVSYTDADGKSNTATIAKDKGAWTADASLPKGVSLDKDKGTVTISSDNVTDGSDVSVTQTDPGREESVPASDRAKTSVPQPKINANDDGSVTVTPSDKANKVTINYTDEDGKQNTATIAKDNNGKWTSNDNKVVIGNDGSITIPADRVKDGSDVTSNQTTNNGKSGDSSATVADAPDNTLKPQTTDKDITITVAGDDIVNKAEADKATVPVAVKVTPKDGETVTGVKVTVNGKEHTATKDANGDGYTAQVPSADIKADTAKTATAKVTLSKAGKTGTVTDTENYTVDIVAPAKPTTPDMTAQTDTGASDEDSNNKPSFTVQTPADGETPVLMVDGKPVAADVVKNNGTTTLTPKQSIPDGDHKVSVAVTDPAGNTSKSSELSITIDTQAPTKPEATIGNGDDKITNDEVDKDGDATIKVKLPGDAKAGDIVVVNGKETPLTQDDIKEGIVEKKVKAPADGSTLHADVFIKDKAGNRSESDSEVFHREVAKPNAPTIELVKDTTRKGFPDGGKDFVTNTNGVKISSDAKDAKIEYRLNGGEWKTYDGAKPITLPENNKSKGVTTKIETKQTVNGKESEIHEQSITIDKKAGLSAGIEKGGDGNYYITGIAEKGSVLTFSGQNIPRGTTLTVTNDDGSFRLPVGKNLATNNVDRTIQVTDKAGNESSVQFTSHEYGNINSTGISGVRPSAVNSATSDNNDYILMGSGGGYGDISSSLASKVKVDTKGGDDTIIAYSKLTAVIGSVEVDMGAGNDTLRVGNNIYGIRNDRTKVLMGDGDDSVVIGDTTLQAKPHTELGNSMSGGVIDLGRGDDIISVYAGISSGARINGGAGFDTLNFTGKGVNQDLGVMTGMEVINLAGTGGNTLNVKISDVLNNADTATTINGQSYQGLFIKGNNQDKVDLGANGSPRRGDKLGGFVKDIREGTAPEGYDAYWDGSNENTHVFIQKGIEVI